MGPLYHVDRNIGHFRKVNAFYSRLAFRQLGLLLKFRVILNKVVFHFALHSVHKKSYRDGLAGADTALAEGSADERILHSTERVQIVFPIRAIDGVNLRFRHI